MKEYEKEMNFASTIEVLPSAIVILNRNKTVQFINSTAKSMLLSELATSQDLSNVDLLRQLRQFNNLMIVSCFGERIQAEENMPTGKKNNVLDALPEDLSSLIRSSQNIPEEQKLISLPIIVEKMLEHENYLRDFLKGKPYKERFLTYEATLDTRSFEILLSVATSGIASSIMVVINETTLRDEVKSLKLKEKHRDLAIASISHEFRTPISSTLLMLENATDHPNLAPEIKNEMLVPARHSLRLLLSLVNDILDYSQMNENKIRLVFADINIHNVVSDSLNVVELLAVRKGIQLIRSFDTSLPSPFSTDANRLAQILLNLLSNAIKFTTKGYVKVSTQKLFMNGKVLAKISVEDTGLGMSEENQAKLFQNYTKIDLGEKAHLNASGVGLGLNIANRLAKALGRGEEDHIQVTSEVGKGSCFTFIIEDKNTERGKERGMSTSITAQAKRLNMSPLMDPPSGQLLLGRPANQIALKKDLNDSLEEGITTQPTFSSALAHSKTFLYDKSKRLSDSKSNISPDTLRVLVVDDDAYNTTAMEIMLKRMKIDVQSALSGEQALEKLFNQDTKEPPFSLVLMDKNMPGLGGVETAKLMRERCKNTKKELMIIGVTGAGMESEVQELLDAGMDDVVLKPLTKAKLEEIISNCKGKNLL